MIKIVPVTPNVVVEKWAEIEPHLNAALPVNLKRYLPIDILAMAIQNQVFFWLVLEDDKLIATIVTRIDQYPRSRSCSVFCIAGEKMKLWFEDAEEILTDYAKRAGCDTFDCCGRKGWEKILDLEPRAIILVKDIAQ